MGNARMIPLTVFAVLALLSCAANANYMVHLRYDNGKITQDGVYHTDADASVSTDGEFNVSVGSYESAFDFPLIMMHDYYFNDTGQGDVPPTVVEATQADTYVVVPGAPAGTNIVVRNDTSVLLNEPIKQAADIEPKPAETTAKNVTNKNATQATGTTTTGQQTGTDTGTTGTKPNGLCLITYAVPALGAAAWYRKREEKQ